jgi:hypothetical protein
MVSSQNRRRISVSISVVSNSSSTQRRGQHDGTIPDVVRSSSVGVDAAFMRQFLQQQTARDLIVGRQPQFGIELFRAQHVVFDDDSHRFAVERNDALIGLLSRQLVFRIECDDEAPIALCVDQLRQRGCIGNDASSRSLAVARMLRSESHSTTSRRIGPSPWICMTMAPLNFRLADSSAAADNISPSTALTAFG